jgi:hypothetical protein
MFLYGYPDKDLRSRAKHKVVLEMSDATLFREETYVCEQIRPWMDENLNGDCFCEVTWRNGLLPNGDYGAAGTNLNMYFSDLSDATLFRLKF